MPNNLSLSTRDIRAIFAEELSDAGGFVSETFDDGGRLFVRSLLPWVQEVRPQDRLQGGVALRAIECDVWVHPYVFRQVCRNGAIQAHAIQTQHLENDDSLPAERVGDALREAVRGCCLEGVFAVAVNEVRSAVDSGVDLALNVIPFLSRFPGSLSGSSQTESVRIFSEILFRFSGGPDRSRFALMNAVTSVARDTRDPEIRWRLEELGGAIPVWRAPPREFEPGAALELPIEEPQRV